MKKNTMATFPAICYVDISFTKNDSSEAFFGIRKICSANISHFMIRLLLYSDVLCIAESENQHKNKR